MLLYYIKKVLNPMLRPIWRPTYRYFNQLSVKYNAFDVGISKLLSGGSNGIRAAKYAEITNDFLLPSRLAIESPHKKLLDQYDVDGDSIFKKNIFEQTDYYKHCAKCIDLTGSDFYDEKEKIVDLARSFINQYKGMYLEKPIHPGQSTIGAPVWVRPIKNSTYYEIIDGHHRVALAYKKGMKRIKALKLPLDPVFTPLQQLLLDVLWINKQKWLYQPIRSPETSEQWILVRNCEDRLGFMKNFLRKADLSPNKKHTYLDVGSSYGWFVDKMIQEGLDSYGVERDCIAIEVGERVYNLPKSRIRNMEIGNYLKNTNEHYDVVSCMSVLHHFILNKNSTSALEIIKNLDRITKKVLFLDTAQNHEKAFAPLLPEWDNEYIINWIKKHTSFTKILVLGKDNDCKPPFENYYNRTFFACMRE